MRIFALGLRVGALLLLLQCTSCWFLLQKKDSDGDGVSDERDHCPSCAEDFDGFEDADGCPEPDNDADGILDVQDQCPNAPESFNGRHDEDGCPDQ